MIGYLIDSSALWRFERDDTVGDAWTPVVQSRAVGSCQPQRVEFKRSARDRADYDAMTDMFEDFYPDVPVKSAWQWIESAQYRLVAQGQHRALSVVAMLIAATAAINGLTVLHDDNDFATLARVVPDIAQWNINELPDL